MAQGALMLIDPPLADVEWRAGPQPDCTVTLPFRGYVAMVWGTEGEPQRFSISKAGAEVRGAVTAGEEVCTGQASTRDFAVWSVRQMLMKLPPGSNDATLGGST